MIRSIKDIIDEKLRKKISKNIAYEFQDYGVRLAEELGDLKRKSLYIKMAKEYPRSLLERAKEYAVGYSRARSKARIFMWFLKENPVVDKPITGI